MTSDERQTEPQSPTMSDAVWPVVVLIGLISSTVILFGVDATSGPLQVALFLSAGFAALLAKKNGFTFEQLRAAAVSGVSSAMSAIFILLAVGALIGTWNMAGTIPTLVSFGVGLLSAKWFYVAAAVICAVVGMVTGSSWTTAGTLGVAFVGMALVLGVSTTIAAGAVISGAYFGDKMCPLSETTILVPQLVGGVKLSEHIRAMAWTAGPSFGLALLVYAVIGLQSPTQGSADVAAAQAALAKAFNVSWVALLPLLVLVLLTLRRYPPFLAILGSALFAGVLGVLTQPTAVAAFVNEPSLGPVATGVTAIFKAMATGYVSVSESEAVDKLFTQGGMASLLTTVWLILGALSFAAIMEHAGFLERLMAPMIARARTNAGLIASVVVTAIGLNIVGGDQYVADVLPSRAFRNEFANRGLSGHVLSRTVEDSGTVTSVLVPWNSCGAYIAGVLGVATSAYFPYCIFNLASPIIEVVVVGLLGFKQDTADPSAAVPEPAGRS